MVGTRPNFVKIAPIYRAFQQYSPVSVKIVHTGQHYDTNMSDIFFQQLHLPQPFYHLGISGGSNTWQTAQIMVAFEQVLTKEKPNIVIVTGDVNSTLACALCAVQNNIRLAHVEAGLRSGDRSMPEEINRILTDAISDYLFTTEVSATENLKREGISLEKIHFVGNCMIDTLITHRKEAAQNSILQRLGLKAKNYVLCTMHRPSNVDSLTGWERLIAVFEEISALGIGAAPLPIVLPLHPRTKLGLEKLGLTDRIKEINNLQIISPQDYMAFLCLLDHAALVITDSGGVQEESTYLQLPCITFRSSTERPVTTTIGTNILVEDLDPKTVAGHVAAIFKGKVKKGRIPPFWDGQSGQRIAAVLAKDLNFAKNTGAD